MKIAKIVLALSAVYSSSIAFGATDAAVATALGGGATVNSSGALTAPSYTVGGATNNNVGAALTALEKKHNTDVAVLRNTSTQINVKTNTNGTSTAAALGGGSTYVATTGQITAPNYVLGAKSYNNVGGALQGLNQSITTMGATVSTVNVKTNTSAAALAAALGGGATYNSTTGQVTNPKYVLGYVTYNNVVDPE